ncbi:MAG: cyclic pyranopterin monophosphate synthase MoaC [Thermoplasmata archaeon]|nr:cyclic pyranopterin monophosphate synthase MoaC [Thermoplasmata archaeon]
MATQRRVHEKPVVFRQATVRGSLRLRPSTVVAIRQRRVEKGDALGAGELAGLLAMKRTPELIPHCHPIPLTGSRVTLSIQRSGVRVEAVAEALWRTGVEMEALVGATIALLTVWDMVKYLEKDERGQYPITRLGPVQVLRKIKRAGKAP